MSSACRKRRVEPLTRGQRRAHAAEHPQLGRFPSGGGVVAPCHGGGGSLRAVAVVMRTEMQLLLLGPFEVVTDLGEGRLPGRGERALLALLALSAGQVVPTNALVD